MGLSHTVSGDIASFRTPSRVPIESLKFHFLPKQEGSGDPSPTNIRPITGWTGLNGERSGKNILDTSTRAMADHYELNGITFDYNSDGSLTVNGKVSDSATTGPQYRLATWTQKVTGNYYICANAPYSGTYNEIYVYDSDLSERPKKWDGVTASQSASSSRPLSEVRLLAGHTYSFNVRINRGTDKTYSNDKFYSMLLPSWCTDTTFEPYSGEQIPITFPDGQTIYGGYIDPIAGEIVAEYELLEGSWGDWPNLSDQGDGTELRYKKFTNPVYGNSINNHHVDYCNIAKYSYSNNNGKVHYYIHASTYNCRVYLPSGYDTTQNIQVIGKLLTPIHIPIAPQDIKTFLDYNNFWSDANDITEVTYPITESKDILATRKKAMAFDRAHHKKVKWNQWAPAVSGTNYAPYNNSNVSCSIENGIITQTFLKKGSSYSFAITTPKNMKTHVLNRYYYVSYEFCTDFAGSIGGTVGGQFASNSVKETTPNVWERCSGVVKRTEGGNFDNYVLYIGWFNTSAGIEIGSTCQMRNPIAIDLTQMFGEGNEPKTASEFERICELNSIDLTTYYSRDTGSDRWLIVP